jgi:hypothetical protein
VRVSPVPEWLYQLYKDDHVRKVFAAPNGDLMDDSIRPADTLVGTVDLDDGEKYRVIRLVATADESDLATLRAGGVVMLTIFGVGMPPVDLNVIGPEDERYC